MSTQPINLLVVDDEPGIRRVIRNSLGATGYAIEEAPTGEAALDLFQRSHCDLVLLDISMPGIGGIETCRRLRRLAPETGIVIISVRGQEEDKVRALEAGADDYVTKPFRYRELLARLRAVYRRTRAAGTAAPVMLRAGVLQLNLQNRILKKNGVELHLSEKEFDILAFLIQFRLR